MSEEGVPTLGERLVHDRLLETEGDPGGHRVRHWSNTTSRRLGPRGPEDLNLLGWSLFGSKACYVKMYQGEDDDGDEAVFVQARFEFPDGPEKRDPAKVVFSFKMEDHPEFLETEIWQRRHNPAIFRELGIHLIKMVNELRANQIADATLRTMELEGPRGVTRMMERLKLEGWAALRRFV